jgi:hypothetical protein
MRVERINASFKVALLLVLAAPFTTGQKHSSVDGCAFGDYGYEQVLDGYFAHARGRNSSAVILRVYGGLAPEYEMVIDPSLSTHTIFRHGARKVIWGKAFDDYMGTHKDAAGYIPVAIKVPVSKKAFDVPETKLQELVARAKEIDSRCENGPFTNSEGKEVVVLDAPYLEVITNSGKIRARVTDTSDFKEIVSQNPSLVQWALDVENATAPVR